VTTAAGRVAGTGGPAGYRRRGPGRAVARPGPRRHTGHSGLSGYRESVPADRYRTLGAIGTAGAPVPGRAQPGRQRRDSGHRGGPGPGRRNGTAGPEPDATMPARSGPR